MAISGPLAKGAPHVINTFSRHVQWHLLDQQVFQHQTMQIEMLQVELCVSIGYELFIDIFELSKMQKIQYRQTPKYPKQTLTDTLA